MPHYDEVFWRHDFYFWPSKQINWSSVSTVLKNVRANVVSTSLEGSTQQTDERTNGRTDDGRAIRAMRLENGHIITLMAADKRFLICWCAFLASCLSGVSIQRNARKVRNKRSQRNGQSVRMETVDASSATSAALLSLRCSRSVR